jgi:hypothetical protein
LWVDALRWLAQSRATQPLRNGQSLGP